MEAIRDDIRTEHTGLHYMTHMSCTCDGTASGAILVGLKGDVSAFVEGDIRRIMALVRAYIKSTHNSILLHLFLNGGCPDDFELDHPCWGCWLDAHLQNVMNDGLTMYTKQAQCNSGTAILRMLVFTFTSLYSRGQLELICDHVQDEKVNALYTDAKKWLVNALSRSRLADK
jgi:hypothetical protein